MESEPRITQLLAAVAAGDTAADEALLERVYAELRRLAHSLLSRDAGHSLQATMLVHDAWFSLVGEQPAQFEGRAHFFGAAAHAMRRLLVDHARARQAMKRGGGLLRVTLCDAPAPQPEDDPQVLELDAALQAFQSVAPDAAKVIELRYFAGLTVPETALALHRSEATVKREWAYARAWLHDRMRSNRGDHE